jgi:hypothetical protein
MCCVYGIYEKVLLRRITEEGVLSAEMAGRSREELGRLD